MKKVFILVLTALLFLTGFTVYGITLETVEAEFDEESTNIVLSAITSAPGINVLTGTTEPATFDTMPSAVRGARDASILKYDIYDNGGENVLRWICTNTDTKYPQLLINIGLENGRMYYYKADNYRTGTNTKEAHWLMYTGGSAATTLTNIPLDTWTTVTKSFTSTKTQDVLGVQHQVTGASNDSPCYYYFDNMILVPYYKVTYMDTYGENVLATDYILFDASGNFLTEFTPDKSKVEGVTGFSTYPGGDLVGSVSLYNEDVVLYAVTKKQASFTHGDVSVAVTLENGEFVFPTPESLEMSVENFRCWSDGTSFYFPGEKVADGASLTGLTFKAVCFDEKLFDVYKGELVYLFTNENVSAWNTPEYLNTKYMSTTRSRADGNASISIHKDTDGNNVSKAVNTISNAYQLFGFGASECLDSSKGTKATIEYDFKYITEASEYAKGSAFVRILNPKDSTDGFAEVYTRATLTKPSEIQEGAWYTATASAIDTTGKGWAGGVVQYQGLPTDKQMIQYIDNYAFYLYPANTFVLLTEKGNEENYIRVEAKSDTYTMPEADAENAIAWTDGANCYMIGETYNVADLQFKALYPFCQDTSKPAMAISFEGNNDIGQGNFYTNGYKYRENIIDEGRNVFHIVYRDANKGDLRLTVKPEAQFDISEYNILSFMVKPNEAWTAEDTHDATADMKFYAHSNESGAISANTLVLNRAVPVSNKYTYVEANLSGNANWNSNAAGYGFYFDIFSGSKYGGSTHIDYVRLYRAGIMTVTYNTNAPEGAEVVNEVAPDTGRGVGTGYLLKGERPEVNGYIFMGWALSSDATSEDVIEIIDLTGNTTVYAVWEKDGTYVAPEKNDSQEIRNNGKNSGIRFKTSIKPSQKEELEEFGFIVTREIFLPKNDDTTDTSALTFNFKKNDATSAEKAPLYVTGVSYDKDGNIDIINSSDVDGNIIYTAVITGIPMSAKKENIIVRTYAKYAFGDRYIVIYGEPMSNSIYAVAEEIKNENGAAYAANKDYIDTILTD